MSGRLVVYPMVGRNHTSGNNGAVVDTLRYDDNAPWPGNTDGQGASMVLCDGIQIMLMGLTGLHLVRLQE